VSIEESPISKRSTVETGDKKKALPDIEGAQEKLGAGLTIDFTAALMEWPTIWKPS
jgi:hypothetical protein